MCSSPTSRAGAVTAVAGAVVIGRAAVLVPGGPRWRRIFVEMLAAQAGWC